MFKRCIVCECIWVCVYVCVCAGSQSHQRGIRSSGVEGIGLWAKEARIGDSKELIGLEIICSMMKESNSNSVFRFSHMWYENNTYSLKCLCASSRFLGANLGLVVRNMLDALSSFIRFKNRSPVSHICYNAKCQAQKQKMTAGHCILQTETLCLRKINNTMRSEHCLQECSFQISKQ